MLSDSLRKTMKLAACAAVLGGGSYFACEMMVPRLTAAQLKSFNESLRTYSDGGNPARESAAIAIRGLGVGALPLLRREFNNTTDAKKRAELNRLIRWVDQRRDPCPRCGMG